MQQTVHPKEWTMLFNLKLGRLWMQELNLEMISIAGIYQ